MLLCTLGHVYFLKLVFLCFSDIYPVIELLGHIVALFLFIYLFLRNLQQLKELLFSMEATPILHFQQRIRLPFPSYLHQHLSFMLFLIIVVLLHQSHQTGVGWHLLWFSFAFPWWLVILRVFPCACWPSACLLWKNGYLGFLSIFN